VAVKRKLIEVSIPLDAINKNSAVEKNVRSGHPSTLHLWWARRPLAAARAVLFAQLVDDPSSHPERFPDEAAQSLERDRLHALIEELSDWENSNDEDLLRRAAQEIATSVGTDAITLLDPFAGGGTIPLEAKRLGLSAHANDLNPLPVLLNNVMLQLVDRFTLSEPVTGGAPGRQAEMLAQDLRVYAELLEADAADRVHENYPAMPDGSVPLVYFWARTVTCPNPACRIETPLVNSWRLSGRRGAEAHMSPVVDLASRVVNVEIVHGSGAEPDGTLSRTGGICVNCGSTIPLPYIKAQGVEHGLGARLLAMQVRVGKSRFFVVPDDAQRKAASIQAPDIDWLDAELSTHSQYMAPPRYGMTRFKDLFSARQLTTLNAFADGLDAVQKRAEQDAYAAGLPDDGVSYSDGGKGARAYGEAMRVLLALGIDRLVNRQSTLCIWHANRGTVEQVFARQAYSMTWLYAEANPFGGASGSFSGQVDYLAKSLAALPQGNGTVTEMPAQAMPVPTNAVVSTDPPYYDNVPYADLSDFFIVWLRRMLGGTVPYFRTLLSPKTDELVADHVRWEGKDRAREFFERGMADVFEHVGTAHHPEIPMTVYYAYKQTDAELEGSASTGWETLLSALIRAGWEIVGTWPIRTEQPGGLRELGRNSLASSVVIVCRRRAASETFGSRADFVRALKSELPEAVRIQRRTSISPVDEQQSAIGPGMAVFSRYASIVESDGSRMTVRDALKVINATLDEVLADQESDFDLPTRFAVSWYRHSGYDAGRFGDADNMARGWNTSVETMARHGILTARGGRVQLLQPDEYPESYDVTADSFVSAWEVMHHAMRIQQAQGIPATGVFLRSAAQRADPIDLELVRDLAHLLYRIADELKRTRDASAFNAFASSWGDFIEAGRAGVPSTDSSVPLDFGGLE
jgi:putative DNA methylase